MSWREPGLWRVLLLALLGTVPLPATGAEAVGARVPCDCRRVAVRWIHPPANEAATPTVLEAQVQVRLERTFDVRMAWPPSRADLLRELDLPDAPGGLSLLSSDRLGYWAVKGVARKKGFELLNARLLTLPLYVFVRERKEPADAKPLLVGIVNPRGYRLANPNRLADLVKEVLGGRRVLVRDLAHPDMLAEELADERSDIGAVALYGEEPSTAIEQFLGRYRSVRESQNHARDDQPLLLLADLRGRQVNLLERTAAGLEHGLLEYPEESFYRFEVAPGSHELQETGTAALGRFELLGRAGEQNLPFLLSNVRARVDARNVDSCCEATLRQVIGDAAVLSADRVYSEKEDGAREAIEHALLLYAFLASRDSGEDSVLRGLLLAAHLALIGEALPSRRVQQQVVAAWGEGGKAILDKLGVRAWPSVRQSFSCDAVGLVQKARRLLAAGSAPGGGSLKEAQELLARALSSDPTPASKKPGCGLTQIANYNPYLYLAQIAAIQRGPGRLRLAATATLTLAPSEGNADGPASREGPQEGSTAGTSR